MKRSRLVIVILAMFAGQVSVGVLNLVYTNHVDHQWCGLLSTLDDAYNSSPQRPATDIGRRLASEIHQRRVTGGC